MRRVARTVVLVAALWPLSAFAQTPHAPSHAAAKWFSFSSKTLHFNVKFPRTWKIITPNPATSRQVTLFTANGAYDLMIEALPFTAASTVSASMQHYLTYQRTVSHSSLYSKVHWTQTTLAGQAAYVGVLKSATEGGATVSDAIYVTQWRGNVLQVLLFASHKPVFAQLRQFPGVYFQILSTLRFQ